MSFAKTAERLLRMRITKPAGCAAQKANMSFAKTAVHLLKAKHLSFKAITLSAKSL
jgi:hypothetical protein